MSRCFFACLVAGAALAAPAPAREVLARRGGWAAFRDGDACVAVAQPLERASAVPPPFLSFTHRAHAAVPLIPRARTGRGHDPARPVTLTAGHRVFVLRSDGAEATAASPRDAMAIVAALRRVPRVAVGATGTHGHAFSDVYPTAGAPTALDAAIVGCLGR